MKTFSAFDVMEQNGGDFNREEECKISMLVSSASNQVHVKVFFLSLKDPESLTLQYLPAYKNLYLRTC